MNLSFPLPASVPLRTSTALVLVACITGCEADDREGPCAGVQLGDLVISEVMANPSGVDDDREWVELHNPGSLDLPLLGLELVRSAADGSERSAIRVGITDLLTAGGYFVLGGMSDAVRPSYVNYAYGDALGNLGNAAGRVTLRCGDRIIDDVEYFETTDGVSRVFDGDLPPDAMRNDDATHWCDSRAPFDTGDFASPGAPNSSCSDNMPGRCRDDGVERDTVFPTEGDLVITEVHPNPLAVADNDGEWFEVLVKADVDLNGIELGRTPGTVLVTLASSDCLRMRAGAHVLFAASRDARTNGGVADVAFQADLALSNAAGSLFVGYAGMVLDSAFYSSTDEGTATALDPRHLTPEGNDDEGVWCHATETYGDGDHGTPGGANVPCRFPVPEGHCEDSDGTRRPIVTPVPGDLIITEVMADPAAVADSMGEWFEVYAAADVDLNGLSGGTTPERPVTLWSDAACRRVRAGSYLLFAHDARSDANGGLPANSIPFDFGLANDPGSLFIGVNGTLLDEVAWSRSPTGASLQLEPADIHAALNDALVEAACEGTAAYGVGDAGTPGTANMDCLDAGECWDGASARSIVSPVLGDLYINEIMPNPSTLEPGTEWFEVAVAADVDLNELIVTAGASRFPLLHDDCIPASQGELLLFARSAVPMSNGDLPLVDFVYASISLTNASGSLELRTTSELLDAVTWNTSLNGVSRALVAGLTLPAEANDTATHWCHTMVAYGATENGNFGTPGAANVCP